ncbi:type III secretion system stator protein SctL [Trinickia acidisoli]|uniref:type III secretion system stator protein SctL n=1 Tax=Trinickia acidisoli TaxID=2767482 RepID=UPI001A8C3978|nr:type III secretion system stator protein SctL [Trinickia acidisoli]
MVIWLRNPNVELSDDIRASVDVGLLEDGDVLRREHYATVVALDEASEACRRRHAAMLADAERRAQDIVTRAEEEALALIEQAQEEYASAERRGYEAGTTQAIGDWHARVAEHAADQRDMHALLRERLAELVVVAVEQIVRSEDTGALFARSTTALDRIAEGCSYLKVRVHPDDYEAAAREFGRFADERRERGRMAPVSVIVDRALAPGACICESDLGTVDASLSTQLAAIRAAVERALERDAAVSAAACDAVVIDPEEETT